MKCNQYETKTGKPIRLWQGDCMDWLKKCEKNEYQLSIVDPPYGIGAGGKSFKNGTSKTKKEYYKENDWDSKRPTRKYFSKLQTVSENQIVWGGNYFADILGEFRCFIFWDKTIHGNSYADGELAWTSFDKVARYYRQNICQIEVEGDRFHPTQKSIKLYRWLLQNYATEGDRILDTHGGSMSLAIACYIEDFELDIIELDEDYYGDAVKRFENHISQKTLF